ncbi:hypothetical protein [Photobacterium galatheae]|uniref:Uncharacterized protein n=1 Tax=Photobacterium galatheae TaxID=1654360 RepID=A0A066RTV9_9GAMM|nr:hypothetical protein [Photobacterium galatheae]KDM90813.1 hypothetical protein EA58_13715 [Photobacterium galatheae]MCM0149219.1 hypothetical protein [Photobacterium galatheae]
MKYKQIKVRIFISLLALSPAAAFAEAEAGEQTQSFIQAAINIQSFIGLFYVVSFIVGATILLSIVSTFADFEKFKQRAENPARQLVVRFIIAGILMNPSTSVMLMSETFGFSVSKESQFCFAYNLNPNTAKGGVDTDGKTRECYKTASNNLQELLKEKHTQLTESELQKFLDGRFKVVVGVFQVIAMYFYLSAWFKIYAISEGKERQTSYGKQVIVLLFSTLFLNLPAAMEQIYLWVSKTGII